MPGVLLHDQKYMHYIENEHNYSSKTHKINKFKAVYLPEMITLDHCYTNNMQDFSRCITQTFCTKKHKVCEWRR